MLTMIISSKKKKHTRSRGWSGKLASESSMGIQNSTEDIKQLVKSESEVPSASPAGSKERPA